MDVMLNSIRQTPHESTFEKIDSIESNGLYSYYSI